MFRFFLYVLSFLWLATQAQADTALPLQGSALYQRLGNDVYLASVFSASMDEQQWRQPGTAVALRMDILTDHLSPRRFYRLWNEGLAINLSEAELTQWSGAMTRFINLLPEDLIAGDQVLISNEQGDCRVRINGIEVLQLPDAAFANLLLAAWIGKFPQSPALREGLISMPPAARAEAGSAVAARHFAAGRAQVVQGWLTPPPAAVVIPVAVAEVAPLRAAPPVVKEKPLPVAAAAPVQKPTPVVASSPAASAKPAAAERKPAAVEPELTDVVSSSAAKVAAVATPQVNESSAVAGQLASARYLRSILRHANSKAVYPERALRHRLEGTVMVAITLDEEGQVLNAETVQSSGSALLDQSAVRAARQAAPYPAPPAVLSADALEFDLPFRFALAH